MPLHVVGRTSTPEIVHYVESGTVYRSTVSRRRALESLQKLASAFEEGLPVRSTRKKEIQECITVLQNFVCTR